ncbi:FG-GAP repeat domain protein [hydrothermal vent metagenome]|uniref:FG-GAP repeat domain protein n=1 Tax=hydrothermal vent metagenome TaxID=652676 RepID=A0A3B0TBH1_9ZZZZ
MMKKAVLFTAIAFGFPAPAMAGDNFSFDVPAMEEVSLEAGITHAYDGPWEFFIGGGAASFDCNGDRMPDLFVAGGTNPAKLYINRSKPAGALRFETGPTGLSDAKSKKILGAYPVNIDNDDYTDLVILRLGENIILKGGPDCAFTAANRAFGFDGGRSWTPAFSATWEADARYPALAFGNYVDRSAPGSPWGTCDKNVFLRPRETQDGGPDYSEALALEPSYCTLSMLFTDWNKSGERALRVTNDRQYYRGGYEQLWRIPPKGAPRQYSSAQGWKKLKIWGMGIAEADLDQDGLPEYALTSMGDTMLQVLDEEADEDRPTYRDMAFEKQMTAHRPYVGTDLKPSTGWHTQFADFNNDTRLDLYIAKGNVEAMPDFARFDPDNLLLGGANGKFHERGYEAGIALPRKGRGAVVEDFNADGQLDLVVVNRGGNVSLFRNTGAATKWGTRPMGNWLGIELQNGQINPDAIGARIVVKTGNLSQSRTVQIGGGHASGQVGFVHFGLGVAERATIRVQWPDGDWSHEYRVFANNFVVIPRGKPDALYWYPKPAE